MVMSGERFGDKYHVAREIGYQLAVETSFLVLPRPQIRYSAPRPARGQEAVYQYCLAADCGLGLLGGRAALCGCLFDEGCDLADDPGDGRLRRVENLCPDVLDDVMARVSTCHDDGLS